MIDFGLGFIAGFASSIVPFAFLIVLLLTIGAIIHHAAKKDGNAARYGVCLAGEVVGCIALVALLVAMRVR